MKVTDFINGKVVYDKASQQLHIRHAINEETYLAQVRGWASISKLRGSVEDLSKFQDEIGQFIADAINDKVGLSSPTCGINTFGIPIHAPLHSPFTDPSITPNKDIVDCIKKGAEVAKDIHDKRKEKNERANNKESLVNGMTNFEGIEELARKKGAEINAYPLYDIGFGMSMMKKWMATHNVNKVGDICYDGMAKVTFISNRSLNYEIRLAPIDGNNLGAGFGNTLSIKFNKL